MVGASVKSVSRAFGYVLSSKVVFGVAHEVDTSDFHVEVVDLLGNRVPAELGVAFSSLPTPYCATRRRSRHCWCSAT